MKPHQRRVVHLLKGASKWILYPLFVFNRRVLSFHNVDEWKPSRVKSCFGWIEIFQFKAQRVWWVLLWQPNSRPDQCTFNALLKVILVSSWVNYTALCNHSLFLLCQGPWINLTEYTGRNNDYLEFSDWSPKTEK